MPHQLQALRPRAPARPPQRPLDIGTLTAKLARVLPQAEIFLALPLLRAIAALKADRAAVVVAHNYQVPLISVGIADFVGDSLAMARYAAQTAAPVIVVCGVHFMAETVKLLCPDKQVLLPNMLAGCSLAAAIGAEDVRSLRRRHPRAPVIAYVNTSAAVKAEADICCTSANAVAVARSLRAERLIMVPDRHLAGYTARQTGLEILTSDGQCEVHVKYSAADIDAYRRDSEVTVLAHPECPRDVQERADFVGSTAAMAEYLGERRPPRVLLLTECSMADNVAVLHPEIEFLKPCNLCSYMKSITLEGVVRVLEDLCNEIRIDAALALRARLPIERMLAL
ncbi:MAG TPA: quinolinate synthase NadA [Steroidobacteraceae bacterium]|nr:quinolinate synthase NadA [Steroidobacteraceae bacterium]